MHRLFIAIDLPEEIKLAISSLRCPLPGAKWVAEAQIHLTLRFIGDVDDELLKMVVASLTDIVAAPFSLAIQGVGCFPPKRDPKVLWVGVDRSSALLGLQGDIEKALALNGLAPEGRPFSPHITIARLKEIPAARVAPFLLKYARFATRFFPVTQFILYSSTLTPQGAIHRQEALFPLRG
ncbi:MAG: RNA 2',3'-cyclic phosphodiesterase [Geobacteraceae bacterium]